MRRLESLPTWCVAVPPAMVAALFALSGLAALVAGRPLIWPQTDLTLAEAVGLRDQGEVVRLIASGADPNRRYAVRNVFRDDETLAMSPLEAAVITREVYMMELVEDYGGIIDARNAAVLQCLAHALDVEDVRQFIIERSREIPCDGVPLPWKP
jgi:hypothetical protein